MRIFYPNYHDASELLHCVAPNMRDTGPSGAILGTVTKQQPAALEALYFAGRAGLRQNSVTRE